MRILVHDFSGHPFQIQLSRALAARGDDVLHAYCGDIQTPKGPLTHAAATTRSDSPCATSVEARSSPSTDWGDASSTNRGYAQRLATELRAFRPDVVLLSNDPPVARLLTVHACRRAGVPVVLWLQDLYALGLSLLFRQRFGRFASRAVTRR